MHTPKGYALPPIAPTSEWSALRHGGHSVCVAASAMVVNLPLETFREGEATLASALSTLEPLDGANHVRPPASLVATTSLSVVHIDFFHSLPSSTSPIDKTRTIRRSITPEHGVNASVDGGKTGHPCEGVMCLLVPSKVT